MRIAVITQFFPTRESPHDGHSAYMTVLRMGRSADVKVYSPHPLYLPPLRPRHRHWRRVDTTYKPVGVNVSYFNYPAMAGLTRPFNGSICARHLEPFLRKDRPDVILNYWIYPDGYAAVRLGKKLGIPVLVKAIGSDLNQRLDFISRRLTLTTLREAALVLTVSENLRQTVIGMGLPSERVRAVLNGCDTTMFHYNGRERARAELGIEVSTRLALYVGRLDVAKGLVELIQATADIVPEMPSLRLAIIGDGSAGPSLKRLVTELGIEDIVKFVGPRPSSEVAVWMRAADVFTLPSHREGCPNTVLEALSTGLPVVATNVGGIPELVDEESGILISPQNPRALATALKSALNRRWNRDQISQRIERGWDAVAEDTLNACRFVLDLAANGRACHDAN